MPRGTSFPARAGSPSAGKPMPRGTSFPARAGSPSAGKPMPRGTRFPARVEHSAPYTRPLEVKPSTSDKTGLLRCFFLLHGAVLDAVRQRFDLRRDLAPERFGFCRYDNTA